MLSQLIAYVNTLCYTSYVMSIHEASATSHTPEQQAVLEIGTLLNDHKFSLAGHGTAEVDPQSFFENGIRVSGGDGLTETAIPIGESNVHTIDDWPHKKWSPTPSIVLLAVPFAEPERGVYFSDIIDHSFRDFSDGRSSIRTYPNELIVGFYNPTIKEIIINPEFDIDSHDAFMAEIGERAQEYREQRRQQLARRLGPVATPTASGPVITHETPEPGGGPLVW